MYLFQLFEFLGIARTAHKIKTVKDAERGWRLNKIFSLPAGKEKKFYLILPVPLLFLNNTVVDSSYLRSGFTSKAVKVVNVVHDRLTSLEIVIYVLLFFSCLY